MSASSLPEETAQHENCDLPAGLGRQRTHPRRLRAPVPRRLHHEMVPKRVPAVSTLPVAEFSTPPLLERGRARQAASAVRGKRNAPKRLKRAVKRLRDREEKQQGGLSDLPGISGRASGRHPNLPQTGKPVLSQPEQDGRRRLRTGSPNSRTWWSPWCRRLTPPRSNIDRTRFFSTKKNIDRIYISTIDAIIRF